MIGGLLGLLGASWHLYKSIRQSVRLSARLSHREYQREYQLMEVEKNLNCFVISSCSHSIIMRMHRWPYGSCFLKIPKNAYQKMTFFYDNLTSFMKSFKSRLPLLAPAPRPLDISPRPQPSCSRPSATPPYVNPGP